jgi:hypothetical protein
MNGLAVAAAGVYAAAGMAQVLAAGWLWTRPGLISGLAAGAATTCATVLPWWLLTVLTYVPVSSDAAACAGISVCVNCALLAGWRSRGGR